MHAKQMQAPDAIPRIAGEFERAFARPSGGLLRTYRADDAETVVLALGSVLGTVEDVVDELRDRGEAVGVVGLKCFRPYPLDEVRRALSGAKRVVPEKAFAVGAGGIVGQNVRLALSGLPIQVYDVVGGLDESTAKFEARRCLSCGNCFACDNCFGVCPDNAVIKLDDPGPYRYEIDLDFCKGCGLCAEECPCGAIEMEPEWI
jgi:Pyruvate/2-oxoacid:ferredoxin oxidoreductase delta subunit